MNHLSKVLVVKILITIFVWGLPLLLFPTGWLERLGFVVPGPQIFLRLFGMAYLALCAGYVFGLRDVLNGNYPAGVVWVGIISNGGAFAILAVAALSNTWEAWGTFAQWFMWGSRVSTGAITTGLVVYGPLYLAANYHSRCDDCEYLTRKDAQG